VWFWWWNFSYVIDVLLSILLRHVYDEK
jgi:hypothetical protein